MRDRRLLYAVAFLRALATGMIGILIGIYLAKRGFDPAEIGTVMGRDRGAALILDQAILPTTTRDADRTAAFAWYNVLQDIGHALGGLAAGAPVLLRRFVAFDEVSSIRATLFKAFGQEIHQGAGTHEPAAAGKAISQRCHPF